MFGIAIAGLLVTSLGNPEPVTVGFLMPGFASLSVASAGPTARLEVTTHEAGSPQTEEWNWHPKKSSDSELTSAKESEGSGWIAGGVVVGALALGVGAGLAAEASTGNLGLGVGLGIAGLIAGGIGGYYLGLLASQGSSAAKFGVIFLTVIEVAAVVGSIVVAAMLTNEHMSSLSIWGPGPAPL